MKNKYTIKRKKKQQQQHALRRMPNNTCAPAKQYYPTWLLMVSTYAHTNVHTYIHTYIVGVFMKLSPVAPALCYCHAREDEEKRKYKTAAKANVCGLLFFVGWRAIWTVYFVKRYIKA